MTPYILRATTNILVYIRSQSLLAQNRIKKVFLIKKVILVKNIAMKKIVIIFHVCCMLIYINFHINVQVYITIFIKWWIL